MSVSGEGNNEIVVTVNARGQIKGSLDSLPADLVEQLTTPQAIEQMRKMYKENRATGRRETRASTRMVQDGEQRDFRHLKPTGMSANEFKKLRKQQFREWKKDAIRQQRSNHGNQALSNPS